MEAKKNQNTTCTSTGMFRKVSTKTVASLDASQLEESRDTPTTSPTRVAATIPDKATRSILTAPV